MDISEPDAQVAVDRLPIAVIQRTEGSTIVPGAQGKLFVGALVRRGRLALINLSLAVGHHMPVPREGLSHIPRTGRCASARDGLHVHARYVGAA